jgi:DNA-binding NtrC family response regulator
MVENKSNDWKRLAKLAAAEEDPEKLPNLVAELNAALSERVQQLRGASPSANLLFVDDEPSIRVTLPPILQQRGFEVQAAGTVPEALQLIESRKFDILLSDLNIAEPGDGFTVVRAMRKVQPRCVTILLTGYPAFESAVEAIRHEVDDYVVKPADIDSLVNILKQKLSARRFKHA